MNVNGFTKYHVLQLSGGNIDIVHDGLFELSPHETEHYEEILNVIQGVINNYRSDPGSSLALFGPSCSR